MTELTFKKYQEKGAYHWKRISKNPFISDCSVIARYKKCINILKIQQGTLKGKRILDLGCGDGVLSYFLCKEGADVYGVDISEIAIEHANKIFNKKKLKAAFVACSCYETPFESNYFDIVISTEVIEHVQHPKLFLQEAYRLLKEKGLALITTPIKLTELPIDKFHVQEWFPNDFQQLNEGFFEDVKTEMSHPVIFRELKNRHVLFKVCLNFVSLLRNPFMSSSPWQFNSIQYCLGTKTLNGSLK